MKVKVYEISTLAKPPKSKHPHYASLGFCSEKDEDYVGIDDFCGEPFPKRWKKPMLEVIEPLRPRGDFFSFGGGAFVVNARAAEVLAAPFEMAGELLPVTVKDEPGDYFVFNITNTINAIDEDRSTWEYAATGTGKRAIRKKAFRANCLGEFSLFKIPEDGGDHMYCWERTGDPIDNEFKAMVEAAGLTGLQFDLVWSGTSKD